MAGKEKHDDGGLSLRTLLISSVSSVAAAVVTHMIWGAGAILGAAITPVIVATVSEFLKRPTRVVHKLKRERGRRARVARDAPARAPAPPAPEVERPDPFGIWKADEPTLWERVRARPLKVGLATGALACVIGVVALTGTELLFGEAVTGGDERTTIFSGSERRGGDGGTTTPSTTEATQTAPEEQPDEKAPRTAPEEPEAAPTTPEQAPTTPEQAPTTPAPPTTPSPDVAPTPEARPSQPSPQPAQPGPSAAPTPSPAN